MISIFLTFLISSGYPRLLGSQSRLG